ncbi:SSS family solute:Na+ symporter [Pullulanibacillus pueri]|uniref:Sodium-coupled permease n=1 Tax=Pullulanibacillus pueri TaxID=1437324 RepID=A0A8J2ZY58_9BACL|nr:sodium:solute symporter family protein [Pullulanibacillus pueri]MBM7683336.1 SSS family solute:Na+ symporter [Pullulanibacillus pueri]GGH86358.1 sodium-coupled permease [Pullulanibacillus pueri]
MGGIDWFVLILFFFLMIGIGVWSFLRVGDAEDYFTAGGKMPWWLSGISHHMSGYSAAVFVAYAAVAYQYGFTLYFWWAIPVSIAIFVGAFTIAPRWARLREKYNIASPMEYLASRYNVPTQQIMAWSGVILKVFDVGAKWAAIAIVLQVFSGLPLWVGILISGGVSLIYSTIGGLWADALTDFVQFIIQLVAGFTMFFIVLAKLGGFGEIGGMWSKLPAHHSDLLAGPYTFWFVFAYLFIDFLSYNGGTWNLAQRYIATPNAKEAKKSALLSGFLYLLWPLILFFPMWAAPILFPNLEQPDQAYAILATNLLPSGLIGLVLAGMFSHTMAMTTSDANAISSVVTRDILPVLTGKKHSLSSKGALVAGRLTTLIFVLLTLLIAVEQNSFGGVLGLIITWFGALVGPVSIPMLLGLLPVFRYCGPAAAITSIIGGVVMFSLDKFVFDVGTAATVGLPILVSFILFVVVGYFTRSVGVRQEVTDILSSISKDRAL